MRQPGSSLGIVLLLAVGFGTARGDEPPASRAPSVPEGWTVERVAGPDLVAHPLMVDLDDRGRLYVAASCGENLERDELEKRLPNFVVRLEDADGDGVFDRSTTFADRMTMPQGCLWHAGALYVASSGAIWKLTDADDDGVAESRERLVGDFGYTGNAADVHGCFLGPEGRIWWCEGRHGHEIRDADGELVSRGRAARIFSCEPDGSDVRTHCTGGMDNPVEIIFSPAGDVIGTVNLMYDQPRGDCLVHWLHDGTYPREDFAASFGEEMLRTGDLLPEIHNFGHVALSGLCRLRGAVESADGSLELMVAVFNTRSVTHATLAPKGATYAVSGMRDVATFENADCHPTDVLQDADGSILVIDTGGWFRIGCPQSQVAKPDVRGAIWRLRPPGHDPPDDPRGERIEWTEIPIETLLRHLDDSRPAVRDRAKEMLARLLSDSTFLTEATKATIGRSFPALGVQGRLALVYAGSRPNARLSAPIACMEDSDATVRQAACRALAYRSDRGYLWETPFGRGVSAGLGDPSPFVRREAATTIGVLFDSPLADEEGPPAEATNALLSLAASTDDRAIEHAALASVIRIDDRETTSAALSSADEKVRVAAALALEQMRRHIDPVGEAPSLTIPAPFSPAPLDDASRERFLAVESSLKAGDAARGRALFFAEKGLCGKCHRVGDEGGRLGPDLSTIGGIRARRDLLESILFPGASFARGFEPYTILTDDGLARSGILLGESATELRVGIDEKRTEAVPFASIESIQASSTSIMPSGFDQRLSTEELADLLAYLQSLKSAPFTK